PPLNLPLTLHDALPILLEAVAEVEVLAVHEIGGVEKADLGDRGPAHQQAGRRAGVDLVGPVRREVAHVVAAEAGAVREEAAQARSEEHTSELQSRGHIV